MAVDADKILVSMLNREASTFGMTRVPFYFGSEKMSGVNIDDFFKTGGEKISSLFFKKIIKMKINPTSVEITQAKRITNVKTAGGRVYYHWLRKGDSSDDYFSNDVMLLKFRGVTGNINLRSPQGFDKLWIFLKLRDLTAEPRLFRDNNGVLRVNRQFCILRTVAMPFTVLFVGFYDSVMKIADTVDSPFQKSWELSFVVERVFPDLTEMSQYLMPQLVSPDLISSLVGE